MPVVCPITFQRFSEAELKELDYAIMKHVFASHNEFGYKAIENVTTIYDLHATMLHLLGLDHERLSFYHNGAGRRLTDVHGEVIHDILG